MVVFSVNEESRLAVAKLYNRTQASLEEDVQVIKNWFSTQPHLPEIMDENTIRNCLLGNRCNIERTKKKIDSYYTVRTKYPEIFLNSHPFNNPRLNQIFSLIYCAIVPNLTKDMCRIAYITVKDEQSALDFDCTAAIIQFLNMGLVKLREDLWFSDIVVVDMKYVTFEKIASVSPKSLATLVKIYESVFPSSMKAVYAINSPAYIEIVLSILKMFMKPKLFQRIHVCRDESILHEKLDKEIILKDYGGDAECYKILHEDLLKQMQKYSELFEYWGDLKVDESLRPEKLKDDEFLGIHGNFKNLSFD